MAYWIKHYAKHEGRGYPGGSEMDPLILSSVMADKIARAGGGLPKTLGDFTRRFHIRRVDRGRLHVLRRLVDGGLFCIVGGHD